MPASLYGYDPNSRLETIQRYHYGARHITWDGRVFKYFNAGGACYTGQLSAFYLSSFINGTTGGLCAAAVKAGENAITFAYANVDSYIAKDVLVGGYISVFGNPGGAANNADCPFRAITGNDPTSAASPILKIYVDMPFDRDIDSGQFCEVYYNPYSDLRLMTGGGQSAAGLAARYMTAAGQKGWVQTWGPNWAAPHVASFNSGAYRDAYANGDGSISSENGEAATGKQRIGFCIQSGLNAGPLLMLQISI
jgi:hypothetical protein